MQYARYEDITGNKLADRGVTYTAASPRFAERRPQPAFMSGPIPDTMDKWYDPEPGPPGAGLITARDAYVFGDRMVFLEGGPLLQVPQSGVHQQLIAWELMRYEAMQENAPMKVREIDEEVVVLSGEPYKLYGHWLVDFMPRLQVLRSLGRDPAKCRYLIPSDLPRFGRSWLKLVGITEQNIIWYDRYTDLCRCRQVLMPTNLRLAGRAVPIMRQAAEYLSDAALAGQVVPPPTRRIYISREGWGNITRKLENVAQVEEVMREYGFDVVYPENKTIVGQAKMFAGASVVVGDYGSALHNAIFSSPQTRVIALRGTFHHPGFLQSGLCEIRDQPMGYVFGRTWVGEDTHQHYLIEPDDLRRCLDTMLADDPPGTIERLRASAVPDDPADNDPFASLQAATAWAWIPYHAADWEESFQRWNAVHDAFPTYEPGFVHTATSLQHLKRLPEAEEMLRAGRARFPNHTQLLTGHAKVLDQMGRSRDGMAALRGRIPEFPNNREVAVDYLRIAHERKFYDDILAVRGTVEAVYPGLLERDNGIRYFFENAERQLAASKGA